MTNKSEITSQFKSYDFDPSNSAGRIIGEIMRQKGISVRTLSRRINYSETEINDFIEGTEIPELEFVASVNQALPLAFDDFVEIVKIVATQLVNEIGNYCDDL